MRKTRLVLLKVVRGLNPIGHVGIGDATAIDVWQEINNGNPQATESVTLILPGRQPINLALQGYRNHGGISNAEFRRWLIENHLDAPGTLLLFEVTTENHAVTYTFKGHVFPVA